MKICPNCGRTFADEDEFCEECGTKLEYQGKSGGKNGGKKSNLPILIGCGVAAVVIIAGTVIGVKAIRGGGSDQEETVVATSESSTTGTSRIGRHETEVSDEEEETAEVTEEAEEEDTADTESETEEAAEAEEEPAAAEEANAEELSTTTYTTMYVVNCNESISLRKSASTSADTYCQIPLGSAVSYVGTADNGFYKVIYNGTTGYALASYLSTDPSASSTPSSSGSSSGTSQYMTVVNCKESITLRKVPSTSADQFCQIPLGATVEFLSTSENGFYMVSYNGYTGYALASYLAWQ